MIARFLKHQPGQFMTKHSGFDMQELFNYPFGEIQAMHICDDFEGFPVNRVLFGNVWDMMTPDML